MNRECRNCAHCHLEEMRRAQSNNGDYGICRNGCSVQVSLGNACRDFRSYTEKQEDGRWLTCPSCGLQSLRLPKVDVQTCACGTVLRGCENTAMSERIDSVNLDLGRAEQRIEKLERWCKELQMRSEGRIGPWDITERLEKLERRQQEVVDWANLTAKANLDRELGPCD